ncbi:MAG TPA: LysR family transcriptional regulator [Clostridiales bacterium]|jgi:molybdate transport system regulatory protein|nr:LysR family transcriptional regulator [Clostridiales bacterium]
MKEELDIRIRATVVTKGGDFKMAFGPGTAELLSRIEETGSLNQAAKAMKMAYSKAWKSIQNTEKNLGFQLIERQGPNGSVLTDDGRAMLTHYRHLTNALKRTSSRHRILERP